MDTFWKEALGILAGCLTTLAYAPQVVRTYKTRSVGDISFLMYLALSLGIALWVVYGVLADSPAIIAANGVSLVMTLTMVGMKLRFSRSFRKKMTRR